MTRYKIRDFDSDFLDVDSNEELVALLRDRVAFVTASSDDEFMTELAHQIMIQSGDVVCCDDADAFIADLITIGFLKEVTGKEEDGEVAKD